MKNTEINISALLEMDQFSGGNPIKRKDVSLSCLTECYLVVGQPRPHTALVKMLRPRLVALGYFQQLTINLLIKSSVTEV